MIRILIVNGPNLNLLGEREPQIYGRETLDEVIGRLRGEAASLGVELSAFQSNHEGALLDCLHQARGRVDGVVLNAGGLTHTSVSLRDAVAAVGYPVILVHLSNLFAREDFRHRDLIAPVGAGLIMGLGTLGYRAALWALRELLTHGGGTGAPAPRS